MTTHYILLIAGLFSISCTVFIVQIQCFVKVLHLVSILIHNKSSEMEIMVESSVYQCMFWTYFVSENALIYQ